MLSEGGRPVASAQVLQRLMPADAIGSELQITAFRNGAFVYMLVTPTELPTRTRRD